MMIARFVLLISMFVLMAASAQAGTSVSDKTIKHIGMGWGGEGAYVTLNEAITPVEGCVDIRFSMPHNTPLFKEN